MGGHVVSLCVAMALPWQPMATRGDVIAMQSTAMASSLRCHAEVHGMEKFVVRHDRTVADRGVPWKFMAQ